MYTITITKEVTSERNLCDHIWVEEVFLTKVGVFLKALFTRLDGERYGLKKDRHDVVREVEIKCARS